MWLLGLLIDRCPVPGRTLRSGLMGVAASLDGVVAVEPGETASCEIRLRNTGQTVDQFTIDVLGDSDGWVTVEPENVRLFPDSEGVAVLTFRPPRLSTVAAGPHSFGVRIFSHEDPEGSVVEEGTVDVAPFVETNAELVPRTSRGRRRTVHELAVDNRGNTPINADLSAWDPDNLLGFDVAPPATVFQPGTATFVKVRVKPKDRFLKGTPKTMPFQVIVSGDRGDEPVYADGTMVQEQLLPPWTLPALLAAVALAIVAFTLWLTLLKPKVVSTARETAKDTVDEPLRQASAQIAALAQKIGEAPPPPLTTETSATTTTTAPGAAGSDRTATEATAGPPGAAGIPVAAGSGPGTPVDGRLETGPGKQTVSYTVPDGKVLVVTDIFLQNPQADSGILRIQRDDGRLLVLRLDDFRALDYHFASPLIFNAAQRLTVDVTCENDQAGTAGATTTQTTCTPAAYWVGLLRDAAPPPPAPPPPPPASPPPAASAG